MGCENTAHSFSKTIKIVITFLEYLSKKNIDADAFLLAEPARYREWEALFAQISPDSFTAQKLFLINEVRRQFLLVSPT